MVSCQHFGPLLGPLNTRCRSILRTQEGTMILTTTHIYTNITNQATNATSITKPREALDAEVAGQAELEASKIRAT